MLPTTIHNGNGAVDYRKLSLMEKWKLSWKGEEISPTITKMADYLAGYSYWFIAITELYVILCYVIPVQFSHWHEMNQYYLKVFACFVFVQSGANWVCIRCYTPEYTVTADRPDISKQLWDDFPDQDVKGNGKMSPKMDVGNGVDSSGSGEGQYFTSQSANISLHWHHCFSCHMDVPPRSHHCKICKKCILKRDHHCYMSGVCIGHTNQRYFIVMNFYIAVASLVGLYYIVQYLHANFYPEMESAWDCFLPVTIYRWFLFTPSEGGIPMEVMLMIVHCYFLWWTGFTAVGFVVMQFGSVYYGLTSHEFMSRVPVRCTGSVSDNFREVFGALWLFNFLWPGQIIFRQTLDGTRWPNLKPDRQKLIANLREKMRQAKVTQEHSRVAELYRDLKLQK